MNDTCLQLYANNKRRATCSKLDCHLENTYSNSHSLSKNAQLNLLCFFPMQFSYEALQRCMLFAHSLLNTSSVIQLRPSESDTMLRSAGNS